MTESEADMHRHQDWLLVSLSSDPPEWGAKERRVMKTLPPWRAVMFARIAQAAGLMSAEEVEVLVQEAREVGADGGLSV